MQNKAIVKNQMDFVQWKNCVCVWKERVSERAQDYRKIGKLYYKGSKNYQQLQREGEGAYVVTFSLSSLTSTASWERGRVLTT